MLYRSSKSVQVQREHYAEPLAKQACRGCEPRGLQATCRCSRWSRSQDRPLPLPSTPQSSFRQLRTGQVPTMSPTTEQRWWWRRYTYAASPRLAAYRWPSCFLCFLPRKDIQPRALGIFHGSSQPQLRSCNRQRRGHRSKPVKLVESRVQ